MDHMKESKHADPDREPKAAHKPTADDGARAADGSARTGQPRRTTQAIAAHAPDMPGPHDSAAASRPSEARLARALTVAGIGTWDWDATTGRQVNSPGFEAPYGRAPGELDTREGFLACVHPDDLAAVQAAIAQAVAGTGGDGFEVEYRVPLPGGGLRWLRSQGAVTRRAADGAALGLSGVASDITARKAAELARHETEERYRLAARATNDAIWDWRLSDGHVVWNEALGELFGHPERETLARWWLDHIHPDDRDRIEHDIHAVIDGRSVNWSAEYRFARAGGGWADVMDRGFVLRDGAGRAVRMIGAMQDLSGRKQSEQQLRDGAERLRIATEAAAIGTWDYHPHSGALRWDARTRALFGLSPEVPVSMDVFRAGLHPDERERVTAAVQAALSPDGPGEFDAEYRTVGIEDGIERWIAAKGRTLFARGRPERFIGTVLDITERKRAERALQDADARKDEFLAMLGHELRNPLAPLTNALRLIERAEPLTERGRAALAMAARQTGQLTHLVDDLLEVSRISRGRIELKREPLAVDAAVRQAIEAIGPEVAARGHQVSLETPPGPLWVEADPVRVAQMLGNLLGNACKYTPNGGRIAVGVSERAGVVEIRVADNGIGVDPDKLPQLFELFHQVGTTLDRSQGGLGIGLALVKRLAELHGGTVRAESAGRGHGAAFTLSLPRAAAAAARPPEAERFAARLRDARLRALYDAWRAARGGEALPAARAVNLLQWAGREHTFLARVATREPLAVEYLRVGRALTDQLGRPLEGTLVGAAQAPALHEALDGLSAPYARCVQDRCPSYDYVRWRGDDGAPVLLERLLLPCADDGAVVTHVLGMVTSQGLG